RVSGPTFSATSPEFFPRSFARLSADHKVLSIGATPGSLGIILSRRGRYDGMETAQFHLERRPPHDQAGRRLYGTQPEDNPLPGRYWSPAVLRAHRDDSPDQAVPEVCPGWPCDRGGTAG